MKFKQLKTEKKTGRGLSGAMLAAIAASVCCVGPLVLLALGVGGAWVGSLTALEPFRPYFMGLTFIFLGYAFYRIYRKPGAEDCEPGSYCANPRSDKINKIALWTVTFVVLILMAIPYATPLLLADQSEARPVKVEKPLQTADANTAIHAGSFEQVTLNVPGMICTSCEVTVQKSLTSLDGVVDAKVDLEGKKAVVRYDSAKVSTADLIEKTTHSGFPSTVK